MFIITNLTTLRKLGFSIFSHQDMHDVVRVAQKITFAWKPENKKKNIDELYKKAKKRTLLRRIERAVPRGPI